MTVTAIEAMAHRNSEFSVFNIFKDGDVPVRKLLVYRRVRDLINHMLLDIYIIYSYAYSINWYMEDIWKYDPLQKNIVETPLIPNFTYILKTPHS